ncbi:MAG: DUF4388 domain-containing protein [Caldilineae bacterium]|nr:MAG: DUF4388 domain-containing protein [Caldilineae bacterium]
MQGNLRDMSVADLIQHTCQERRTARLTIARDGQKAVLYFQDGTLPHAELGSQIGEEVIYEILNWTEGEFLLETGLTPPQTTIQRSWSGLLLEGARRLDEATQKAETHLTQEEKPMAKKKSELLADTLAELLEESSDIHGVAVVGVDGLVYSANVPQRTLDENIVGAASAAVLGLSRRSVEQLNRGNFKQTLIQGDGGNIIVASINDETLLVGLTPANVNLGMAFAEVRSVTATLREIL